MYWALYPPTDCDKDRLTWYFSDQGFQFLEQVILVSKINKVDMKERRRWSKVEERLSVFNSIKNKFCGTFNKSINHYSSLVHYKS